MQGALDRRTPAHLWIVGALALLWNAFGAVDYLMTRLRNTDYFASMMPGVDPNALLAWIDAFPVWAQFGWGLGVWMGLAGAILLLMRHRWATWAFSFSAIGAIVGLGYQLVLAPPMPGGETAMTRIMPAIIIIVAVLFYLYAQAQEKRRVLR